MVILRIGGSHSRSDTDFADVSVGYYLLSVHLVYRVSETRGVGLPVLMRLKRYEEALKAIAMVFGTTVGLVLRSQTCQS